MTHIHHFGLHWQDNLVFLHERAGVRCLNQGLERLESPFISDIPRWTVCPHQLPDPQSGPALSHSLVKVMGPDQRGDLFFVEERHAGLLWRLTRMTGSPRAVHLYTGHHRQKRLDQAMRQLATTNAAPLVLLGWGAQHLSEMEQVAQGYRTRNLVLCGPLRPPHAHRLSVDGIDLDHDWVTEGRRQLHDLIRRRTS